MSQIVEKFPISQLWRDFQKIPTSGIRIQKQRTSKI